MRLVLVCLAVAAAKGGVIQGVVLEQASERPLARTQVRLDPIKNGTTPLRPMQVTTNRNGGFIFPEVPDGMYFAIVPTSRVFSRRLRAAAA
jgi:hypothetical protein